DWGTLVRPARSSACERARATEAAAFTRTRTAGSIPTAQDQPPRKTDMPPKKKLVKTFTLQLPAGQATPAPPVGPPLGQHGVDIMELVEQYKAQTGPQRGDILPPQMRGFEDRTVPFFPKTPPPGEGTKGAAR